MKILIKNRHGEIIKFKSKNRCIDDKTHNFEKCEQREYDTFWEGRLKTVIQFMICKKCGQKVK